MIRFLRILLTPSRAIAAALTRLSDEIRSLRILYEMDLAARVPPIIRVTEDPRRDDTEISNMNENDAPAGKKWKRLGNTIWATVPASVDEDSDDD
jgi:hypothetical protein